MEYLPFGLNIAKQAGKIIEKYFGLQMQKKWKTDNTPVTEADIEINKLVIKSIKKYFPNHNILGEEESSLESKSDYLWVCDPVDGTFPFSHGIPTCVFSLALVYKGVVKLGIIYDPFLDRLFYAEKGKGAYLNGRPIHVSTKKDLKNSMIGLLYWLNSTPDTISLIEPLEREGAIAFSLVSTLYMGALVACGELSGIIFPGNKTHDAASLKILIDEAGGKMTSIFGKEQLYDKNINGYIAANKPLHGQLLKIVKEKAK